MAHLRNIRAARRRLTSTAAATAVLLSGGLAAALAQAPAQATTHAAAGGAVPRYYIDEVIGVRDPVIRATATGVVTGSVRCPSGRAEDFVPVRHQTFFVDCQTAAGDSLLYRFRLTAAGRAVGYKLVLGGALKGLIDTLAASADGSTLAVIVGAAASARDVIVITPRKGGDRVVWQDGPTGPGMIRLRPFHLALTGNGRELLVLGSPKCVKGSAGQACRATGEEVRAVSPASGGGSLSSSRLIMRQSQITSLREGYINDVSVTPDGRSLIVAVVSGGVRINGGFVAVDRVSAATGRRTSQLFRMKTGNGFSYRFVSVDPSGRYVLFDAGTTRVDVNGWIDHGRLVRLRPAGNNGFYGAWAGR